MIVAVDLSLTSTGLAIWRPGEALELQTINGKTTSGMERVAMICRHIWALTRDPNVLVMLEGYAYSRTNGKFLDLAELRGILMYPLWCQSMLTMTISPTALKKYATGRGSTGKDKDTGEVIPTDKTAVTMAARARYGHLVTIRNDDEADALVLAAMALHKYGAPLAPVPKANAAAIEGTAKEPIKWPHFRIGGPLDA